MLHNVVVTPRSLDFEIKQGENVTTANCVLLPNPNLNFDQDTQNVVHMIKEVVKKYLHMTRNRSRSRCTSCIATSLSSLSDD